MIFLGHVHVYSIVRCVLKIYHTLQILCIPDRSAVGADIFKRTNRMQTSGAHIVAKVP